MPKTNEFNEHEFDKKTLFLHPDAMSSKVGSALKMSNFLLLRIALLKLITFHFTTTLIGKLVTIGKY